MRRAASTISAAGARSPSSKPSERATAALEVASARQPFTAASAFALATSQAFGSTRIGGSRCIRTPSLSPVGPSACSLLQIGEDGEHAPVAVLRGRQPQLLKDARDVLLDSADRQHERIGDAGVRAWASYPVAGTSYCGGSAPRRIHAANSGSTI